MTTQAAEQADRAIRKFIGSDDSIDYGLLIEVLRKSCEMASNGQAVRVGSDLHADLIACRDMVHLSIHVEAHNASVANY